MHLDRKIIKYYTNSRKNEEQEEYIRDTFKRVCGRCEQIKLSYRKSLGS